MSSLGLQPLEIISQIGENLPLQDCVNMIRVTKKYQNLFEELTKKKLKEKVLTRLTKLVAGNTDNLLIPEHIVANHFKDIAVLLMYLSNLGVIAGGSMVYALNNFVPGSSVGDIDVFINDKVKFLEAFRILKSRTYFDQILVSNPGKYFQGDLSGVIPSEGPDEVEDSKISIITFVFKDAIPGVDRKGSDSIWPRIQLIFQNFERPEEVIESFDLDYVQCAYHQGQVYLTEICKQSHINRTVFKATEFPPTIDRLEKAYHKGFKVPIFGNYESSNYKTTLSFDLTEDNISPIRRRSKIRKMYDLTKIKAVGFKECKVEMWKNNEMKYGKITLLIDDAELDVSYISTEINVLNDERHVEVPGTTINHCKNKSEVKTILGKHIVKASLYLCNGFFRLRSDQVYSTGNAISISLANPKFSDSEDLKDPEDESTKIKNLINTKIKNLINKHQK